MLRLRARLSRGRLLLEAIAQGGLDAIVQVVIPQAAALHLQSQLQRVAYPTLSPQAIAQPSVALAADRPLAAGVTQQRIPPEISSRW